MAFRLLIDIEVLEFVERLPPRLRQEIRTAIREIQANPGAQTEAEDSDSSGRPLSIKIVGDYAITFWIDHADKHVKIMDIHSADC